MLSFNLYFQQKRTPKLPLTDETLCLSFDVTNRTNVFSNFQSYHEVVMYPLQPSPQKDALGTRLVSLKLISQKLYAILKILVNH